MTQALTGFFLGTRPYQPIFELMQQLFEARRAGAVGDVVLLLEHEAVITLGRGAKLENLLATPQQLAQLGVEVVETGRGGDVTLHAPGQLIAYPIVDLNPDRRDVRKYVKALTAAMNEVISGYGLEGGTIEDLIGLWLDLDNSQHWPGEAAATTPAKIGAIGVRISRWITQHGFALNLSTDLGLFRLIVPCGIKEHGVTSLRQLTGESPSVETTAKQALAALNARLGSGKAAFIDLKEVPAEALYSHIVEYFAGSPGLVHENALSE